MAIEHMKPLSPCRSPRCGNRGPGYSPTCQGLVANPLLVPIHGRGVWLFGKWRDVMDLIRLFSAHGPYVPALGTAVVVSAGQFARGRQKPARRTATRWTVRFRVHGWGTTHHPSEMAVRAIRESPYRNQCLCSKRSETPPLLAKYLALMIRADTTAPVVNDEEKLARAQRRHTRLPAMVTALTSARWQFGQGVTGRPLWSLGLSMLGSSAYCSREGYGFGGSGVT